MGEFDLFAIIIGSLLKIFLVYILLGAIVIVIVESITSITRWRGIVLHRQLLNAIGSDYLYNKILSHPLLISLGKYPSYIHLDYCALAIMDIVKKMETDSMDPDEFISPEKNNFIKVVKFFQDESSHHDPKKANEKFKASLRDWLLDLMRIAGGKYKTRIQFLVFIVSFLLVVSVNLDMFKWINTFNQNALLDGVVNLIESTEKIDKANLTAFLNAEKKIPIGWSEADKPRSFSEWILKLAGIMASTMMTAFSALVSFQMLGKYVNIRGTSSKPTYT